MAEPDETRLTDEHTATLSLVERELRADGSRPECRDQRLGCVVTGSGGEEHDVAGVGSEGRDEGLVHPLQASSGRQGEGSSDAPRRWAGVSRSATSTKASGLPSVAADEPSDDRTMDAG